MLVHFEGVGAGRGWHLEDIRGSDREGLEGGEGKKAAGFGSTHWTEQADSPIDAHAP